MSYYDNVFIDAIYIQTQDNYSETGPTGKEEAKTFYKITYDEDVKRVREFIDVDSVSNNLFFVYIIARGTADEGTPCGMSDYMITSVVYDKCPIFKNLMSGLGNIGDDCTPPVDLLNQYFRYKAFQLAIDTGDYTSAIKYWNRFFGQKYKKVTRKCGCRG